MGKHENGFERVDRDLYPTPRWPVDALAEHVNLVGKVIWECAVGTGMMAEALKANGVARVFCSDVVDHGYTGLDGLFDFVSDTPSNSQRLDGIITNPPYGLRNTPGGNVHRGRTPAPAAGRIPLFVAASGF